MFWLTLNFVSGCLKGFLHCRCIDLRYPKIILNFVSLVKNNFRRLPRRAFGTARNDEKGSLPLLWSHLWE
ncbi:MAG: hypothetical protein IKX14_08545 [Neisseriaceae bacterium]|nr:hypothetical protein [Neisseriaceae bacterium]